MRPEASDGLYPQNRSRSPDARRFEATEAAPPGSLPLLAAPGLLFGCPARLRNVLWPKLGRLVSLLRPLCLRLFHQRLVFGERSSGGLGGGAVGGFLGGLFFCAGQGARVGCPAFSQGAAASAPLFGEDNVADGRVQLGDAEPRHLVDAVGDPASHLIDGLQDIPAVLDAHREVYGGFDPAYLDGDAARLALRAGYAAEDAAGGPRRAATHVYALYLLGSPPRYGRDYSVANGGVAALAHERAVVSLLVLLAHLLSSSANHCSTNGSPNSRVATVSR